jgi:predicted transcriptional regulator YheO
MVTRGGPVAVTRPVAAGCASWRRMEGQVSDAARTEMQEVVLFLDERGAFLVPRAVEDVAGRLRGITVCNYLEGSD